MNTLSGMKTGLLIGTVYLVLAANPESKFLILLVFCIVPLLVNVLITCAAAASTSRVGVSFATSLVPSLGTMAGISS